MPLRARRLPSGTIVDDASEVAGPGRCVVAGQPAAADDLVREMVEVLTSMRTRLYGRRGTRNRAIQAVTATKHEPSGVAG